MIGLDTNVIVRFLTRDDKEQFPKAYAILKTEEVFISDTVLLETEWVLRYAYEFSREKLQVALERLLGLPNVHVADAQRIALAMKWHKAGLDFADALHLATTRDLSDFVTFDRAFIKQSAGLCDCKVREPKAL